MKKIAANYWIFLNLGAMLSLVYVLKSSTKPFILYIAIASLLIGISCYMIHKKKPQGL